MVTSVALVKQQFAQYNLQKSGLGEKSLHYSKFKKVSANPDSLSKGCHAFARSTKKKIVSMIFWQDVEEGVQKCLLYEVQSEKNQSLFCQVLPIAIVHNSRLEMHHNKKKPEVFPLFLPLRKLNVSCKTCVLPCMISILQWTLTIHKQHSGCTQIQSELQARGSNIMVRAKNITKQFYLLKKIH